MLTNIYKHVKYKKKTSPIVLHFNNVSSCSSSSGQFKNKILL